MEYPNDNKLNQPSAENQGQNFSNMPPQNSSRNLKIIIGVLIVLLVGALGVAGYFVFKNKTISPSEQSTANNNQNTSTNTPTSLPFNLSVWELSLIKDEIKASSNLVENNLIYAVKSEYTSTVYKRNLQSGAQTKILEFVENSKADKSGNLWSGLPSNIALSPDKKSLAFIDKEGLKVYDLQTKNTKTFIRKTEEGSSETEAPPKWSIGSLGGTYSLARPLWSSDEKYISFLQSHYEGASFGVVDVESGAYIALKNVAGGYSNLSWSPVSRSYVKASSGGYEGIGLYVSSQNNIAEANNIALKFGKTEDTPFLEANFSSDGRKIVFTFEEPYDTRHLAIANTDGTGFMVLAEKTDAKTPFFSSDGNSVLYFQQKNGKQVLVRYDLANKKSTDLIILPSEFNRWEKAYWTKDNFLALVGISSSSGLTLGGDNTRMLILDIANKKVMYASPVFDQFTNFTGLSN